MARRASDEKIRVESTPPVELLVLVFPLDGARAARCARCARLCRMRIDRAAIVNLVLQKEGEAAGGLLPQWISGTEFLFPERGGSSGGARLGERDRARSRAGPGI